jgi:hypothetical protein
MYTRNDFVLQVKFPIVIDVLSERAKDMRDAGKT